ncbi:MAG: DUF3500 domain-containing protein [Oceanobacter sp.]
MKTPHSARLSFVTAILSTLLLLAGCVSDDESSTQTSSESSSSSDTDSSTDSSDDSTSTDTDDTASSDSDDASTDDSVSETTITDCSDDAHITEIVCAVNAFIDTLDTSEQDELMYDWSESQARTVWSNLPAGSVQRNGIAFGDLSEEQLAVALAVAKVALTDDGYETFIGILASDDYLAAQGNRGGYGSDLYYMAVFGTPGVSNDWMLQIGGHHLALNMTYLSGTGYPAPALIAVEPKASFTYSGTTYEPMAKKGDALVAMFDALDSSELSNAYLSGQSFSDVLIGPDNGSGVLPDDYPSGSNRTGMLVSNLTDDQQALVIAAMESYVRDYPADVADALMEEYSSDAALADTYIAWAGSESAGIDVDTSGTYMRIDGPRLWIEIACQNGVVLSGTHYHSIYRDKDMDYGNSL